MPPVAAREGDVLGPDVCLGQANTPWVRVVCVLRSLEASGSPVLPVTGAAGDNDPLDWTTHRQRDKSMEERFWEKVDKNGPITGSLATPCWVWLAGKSRQGYGLFYIGDRKYRASHRVAWVEFGGMDIPDGHEILHRCNNRWCVNYVDHLFLGGPTGHVEWRDAQNRQAQGDNSGPRLHPEAFPRGERSGSRLHPETRCRGDDKPQAKLRADDVGVILRQLAAGVEKKKIAADFGVADTTIADIAYGRTWTHLTGLTATTSGIKREKRSSPVFGCGHGKDQNTSASGTCLICRRKRYALNGRTYQATYRNKQKALALVGSLA